MTFELEIIPKEAWETTVEHPVPIPLPAEYNFLHHTAGSVDVGGNGQWIDDAQQVDRVSEGRGFADISYSHLGSQSGVVLEGRGWGVAGAHTITDTGFSFNKIAHAFAAFGNFENTRPSAELLESIAQWHAFSIVKGYTARGRLRYHAQVRSTACPGKHLIAKMGAINERANQIIDNPEMRNTMSSTVIPTEKHQIEEIQRRLVANDYDLGTFGPSRDGVDGDWGNLTQIAWDAYTQPLAHLARISQDESDLEDKITELEDTLVYVDELKQELEGKVKDLGKANANIDELGNTLDTAKRNANQLATELAKSDVDLTDALQRLSASNLSITILDARIEELETSDGASDIIVDWQKANLAMSQWLKARE